MQTDILIIGGGLSGLLATWQLRQAGKEAYVMEARTRFGGRVLTMSGSDGSDCDLGPSWFWPGQPVIVSLLNAFSIPFYEQFVDGGLVFQNRDGSVERTTGTSPMAGSLRIEGGANHLTDAIVDKIDASHRLLGHVVSGLARTKEGILVDVAGPSGPKQVLAKKVAVAIPPRLAAHLTFSPELPRKTMETLVSTPTWMAGHAKFFAIYKEPFWRENGLCGTAFSECGPLAEIHDASPHSGGMFNLFGFSGLPAERRAGMGRSEFIKQALAQLAMLFGNKARQPQAVHFQDWSTEKFTACDIDRAPQEHHPQYGLSLQLGNTWEGRLEFISTETSFTNGGLMEGALESGLRYSKSIAGLGIGLTDDTHRPQTAGMDWEWF